jgi:hypothetical protein
MSIVEDVRKVLQDFLAPELRTANARFAALDACFSAVDEKLQAQSKITEVNHREIMTRIDAISDRIDGLKTSLDLDKRVERLESRQIHHPA